MASEEKSIEEAQSNWPDAESRFYAKLQSRAEELERALKRQTEKVLEERGTVMDLTADNQRLRELLRDCQYELMPHAYELRYKIEAALGE